MIRAVVVQRAIGAMLMAALMAFRPTASVAGHYGCTGKVSQVTTDPTGTVNATFEFPGGGVAWQDVCSLSAAAHNVSMAACKAIAATLLSAKLTGGNVLLFFDKAGECCSAPVWRPLSDSRWYWGPSVL